MIIELKTKTTDELKAFAFDLILEQQQIVKSLQILTTEIQARQIPPIKSKESDGGQADS